MRLLVPLASRLGGPANRASASLSASRLDSHPLANTPSAPQSRLTAGQSKKKLREEQAEKPSVELSETHGLGSADSPRSASRMRSGIPRQRPAPRYGDEAAGRDPCGERERDRGFEGRDELDQGDKRDRVGEARLATERG